MNDFVNYVRTQFKFLWLIKCEKDVGASLKLITEFRNANFVIEGEATAR